MSRAARRRRDRWPSREEAWTRLHDRGIYRGWRDDAFDCFIEHATRDEDGERALTCPTWLEAEIFDPPVYPWHALRQLQCPELRRASFWERVCRYVWISVVAGS